VTRPRILFAALFALLAASRLCHVGVMWAEENLPAAAAAQMLRGHTLYRDLWFDKPPVLPAVYLLWGGQDGWMARAAGALFALGLCALAWAFARDLWGRREACWAAALMAFFLVFYFPAAVIPLASDLLLAAPHLAAVWMAWKRRPFWSGALAGVAFLINPKGLFVLAACVLWSWSSLPLLALGFLAPNALALLCLWAAGALPAYYEQVWAWGRLYAGGTFVADPVRNGILRTLHWVGFHAALAVAAFFAATRRPRELDWRWAAWALISLAAVAAGWRFFPRYYFQLLPVAVLAAARGISLMGPRRWIALALLAVPLVRFGPRYVLVARGEPWADTAMDRDSRAAAALLRSQAHPGATLFVWGFRPELYVYSDLDASTLYLDSQPLTGIPADRHLSAASAVAAAPALARRRELTRTAPDFIIDGLGPYNPSLALSAYPDLAPWLAAYRPAGRTAGCILYRRAAP